MPPRGPERSVLAAAALAAVVMLGVALAVIGGALSALGPASPSLPAAERLLLGGYLVLNLPGLDRPAAGAGGSYVLDVEPGQSAGEVAEQLAAAGVLDRPGLFLRYLRYRGLDTAIEAGRFEVAGAMTLRELADRLQEARDSRYTLTLVEGWRREEVAQALGGLGLAFSAGDFLAATRRLPPAWVEAPAHADDLEGLLFPDTYRLDPRQSADGVVDDMLENLRSRLEADLRAGFESNGLSVYQAITLASIVEREAVRPEERPLIASVFLNRLALGIPLQADPTVQYALAIQPDGSWWKAPLSADDLRFDSSYNTYLYGGLPPGPIANPGSASLSSVAFPAETGYLFFRAACDGSGRHSFAVTFEEHVRNACP